MRSMQISSQVRLASYLAKFIASVLQLLFDHVIVTAIAVIAATCRTGPFLALLVLLSSLLVFLLVLSCRLFLFNIVITVACNDFLGRSIICLRGNRWEHRCIISRNESVSIVCKELFNVINWLVLVLLFYLLLRLPDLFLLRFPGFFSLLLLLSLLFAPI